MNTKTSVISKLEEHSDLFLIHLWQRGYEASFEVVYKRYILQLVEMLTRKTGSVETASELAQDTFLAIYLSRETIHEVRDFRSFLFSIARNKVFNYYRHELVRQKYQQFVRLNGADPGEGVDDMLENKELQNLIRQEIEQLPPKCRQVFKLSREENLPHKSIAAMLNISENTVEQHVRKALGILRTMLHNYYKMNRTSDPGLYLAMIISSWACQIFLERQ